MLSPHPVNGIPFNPKKNGNKRMQPGTSRSNTIGAKWLLLFEKMTGVLPSREGASKNDLAKAVRYPRENLIPPIDWCVTEFNLG
jgi:hypothetical protein